MTWMSEYRVVIYEVRKFNRRLRQFELTTYYSDGSCDVRRIPA